ncbi:hypothetical protein MMC14_008920 [Varicellaria rhodocarpa]|nr:hypothetical protein [Varicellaria rhodocarpa]
MDTRFITVTIENIFMPIPARSPGDIDPEVGVHLIMNLVNNLVNLQNGERRQAIIYRASSLSRRTGEMRRGETQTWWEQVITPTPPVEMTYECDASLGSPTLIDCAQLRWQGRGNPSDAVQIGPGRPKSFLSSKYHYFRVLSIHFKTNPSS